MMQISYSQLRQHLKQAIKTVAANHEPTVITSHDKPTAVLLSYDDYRALEETAYLLRSPTNAKRLLEAVNDIAKKRRIKKKGLLEDET